MCVHVCVCVCARVVGVCVEEKGVLKDAVTVQHIHVHCTIGWGCSWLQ